MAKVGLNKLGLKKRVDTVELIINDEKIEVLQYLPIQEKVSLVTQSVRGATVDGLIDPLLMDTFLHFMILKGYTNISFTEKQMSNLLETFDLLEGNGVLKLVLEHIPEDEYESIYNSAQDVMNNNREMLKSMTSGAASVVAATKNI